MKVVKWQRWSMDLDDFSNSGGPEHEEALVDLIVRRGYAFSGQYHQGGEFGVPVFSDGKILQCSMRYWGGIMARAWNIREKAQKYDYMDFYIQSTFCMEKEKVPNGNE